MKSVFVFLVLVVTFAQTRKINVEKLLRELEEINDLNSGEFHRGSNKFHKKEKKPETLGEFIKRKGRYMEKRDSNGTSCPLVCGLPPQIDETATCDTKWEQELETKSGCSCVSEYKCCPRTGECPPPANVTICQSGGQAGLLHGVLDKDCCGCDVVKCIECDEPDDYNNTCTTSAMAGLPAACWTYNENGKNNTNTGCFESTCDFTPPDAPADETCDTTCMREETTQDKCGTNYKVCAGNRNSSACTRDSVQTCSVGLAYNVKCYDSPVRIPDPDAGFFYNGNKSCESCMMWNFTKKACLPDTLDCHLYGSNMYDRTCWVKSSNPDDCNCDIGECTSNSEDSTNQKFLPAQVCPKNTVKKAGQSICGQDRDICMPCEDIPDEGTPELETYKTNMNCPSYGSLIHQPATATSCRSYECVIPKVPDDCSCDTFRLDSSTKAFVCKCT